MNVKGIRWEYCRETMEDRQDEPSLIVEIFVIHGGHSFFVSSCRHLEDWHVRITRVSIIDLIAEMNSEGMDREYEREKIADTVYESYDFKQNDIPEELRESEFYNAIKLAWLVRRTALPMTEESAEEVEMLIKKWQGQDLTNLVI